MTVSEVNDVSAPTATPTGCSGIVTVASSLTQGTWSSGAMGSLSGTITLVALASGTCTLQISDNNGQSVTVTLTALVTGAITEFASHVSNPANNYGMTVGSDGNIWVAEANATIGKITPSSGTLTEYNLYTALGGATANPAIVGITNGPDGNIWLVVAVGNNYAEFAKVSTSGSLLVTYTVANGKQPSGPIAAGADGNLWYSYGGGGIYSVSTSGTASIQCVFSDAWGNATIAASADKKTFYSVTVGGNGGSNVPPTLVTATTTGGCTNAQLNGNFIFLTPYFDQNDGGLDITNFASQQQISYNTSAVASDGSVWVVMDTQACAGSDPCTNSTEPTTPSSIYKIGMSNITTVAGNPISLAAGADGNVWITANDNGQGIIIKMSTDLTTSANYTKLTSGGTLSSIPESIVYGPDGNYYFVEGSGKIGYISP